MIDHLRHMAETRPAGMDRDAARWALAEIDRLQVALLEIIDLDYRAGQLPSEQTIAAQNALDYEQRSD